MKRMVRVNELLKRELGEVFEKDICPGLSCLVTVTAINTSPDLHHAIVYVSIYGCDDDERQRVLCLIKSKRTELQRKVARHVRLKYTPVLRFELDDKFDQADRVYAILDSLNINDDDDEADPSDVP